MKKLRVYLDTSVFGGCFDAEFAAASRKLFEEIRAGRYTVVLSEMTLIELQRAPAEVRGLLERMPTDLLEQIALDDEVAALRDAYLAAGVVGPASSGDAAHVASATVAGAELIVSWNFRHIVNFDKIRAYNGVNLVRGYAALEIRSPQEVVHEEEI